MSSQPYRAICPMTYKLQVDSLAWVAPAAILVSCKLLTDGTEEPYAPLAMLTWQGDAPAAGNAELAGVALSAGDRCRVGLHWVHVAAPRFASWLQPVETLPSGYGWLWLRHCKLPTAKAAGCTHLPLRRVLCQQHFRGCRSPGALAADRHGAAGA